MYKMELEQFTFLFDCHPCWFDIILKEELWKLTIQRLTTNKQKKIQEDQTALQLL